MCPHCCFILMPCCSEYCSVSVTILFHSHYDLNLLIPNPTPSVPVTLLHSACLCCWKLCSAMITIDLEVCTWFCDASSLLMPLAFRKALSLFYHHTMMVFSGSVVLMGYSSGCSSDLFTIALMFTVEVIPSYLPFCNYRCDVWLLWRVGTVHFCCSEWYDALPAFCYACLFSYHSFWWYIAITIPLTAIDCCYTYILEACLMSLSTFVILHDTFCSVVCWCIGDCHCCSEWHLLFDAGYLYVSLVYHCSSVAVVTDLCLFGGGERLANAAILISAGQSGWLSKYGGNIEMKWLIVSCGGWPVQYNAGYNVWLWL